MIRPFSNGTQYGDWEGANCERCTNGAPAGEWPPCEIQAALCMAYVGDGTVTSKIARRMGYDLLRYNWQCGEWERRHVEEAAS